MDVLYLSNKTTKQAYSKLLMRRVKDKYIKDNISLKKMPNKKTNKTKQIKQTKHKTKPWVK
jgi:hypothetical protein